MWAGEGYAQCQNVERSEGVERDEGCEVVASSVAEIRWLRR